MKFPTLILSVLLASVSAQTTTTSTCSAGFSAPAGVCPTPYDSCCAYICAEAQVPFAVCQPTDGTGQFATCTACAGGSSTTATSTTTTMVSSTTSSASTCSPFSAPAGVCPTPYDSCCAYICGEAQVPFAVCQPTDGTGQFASCSACAGASSTGVGSSTSAIASSTITMTSTTTTCTSSVAGNVTTSLPPPIYSSGAGSSDFTLSVATVFGLLIVMFAL
ncbi:hypothetical protein TWF694_009390 [Orbilia ellipsospora]|uniref:Uncharacterized protein n=1 Tax=Orbilia ellipsospora TaxID=2528407 RepID=A0AAV9XAZ2_9PEZI